MTAPAPLSVRVARSLDAFEQMQSDWTELFRAADTSPISLSHAWVGEVWRQLPPKRSNTVFALIVYRAGEPVLGGAFQRGRRGLRLTLDLLGAALPQVRDILYAPGLDISAFDTLFAALRRLEPFRTSVNFAGTPARSPLLFGLHRGGGTMTLRRSMEGASLHLPPFGDHAAWLATRSAKYRSNLSLSWRHLQRDGVVFAREPAEQWREALAWLLTNKATWLQQRGLRHDWAIDGTAQRIFEALHDSASSKGQLRLDTLRRDGSIIGAALTVAEGKSLRLIMSTYDPRFEKHSPGWLLHNFALRDAFAEGFERLDFGRGTLEWKSRFTDTRYEVLSGRARIPSRSISAPGSKPLPPVIIEPIASAL